jgi:hypothetical protein
MLEKFIPIYCIILSGIGFVCFNYPKPLRKILFYLFGTFILISSYLFTYSMSTVKALNHALSNYDTIRKINPCDTIALFKQADTEADIAKSVIETTEVQELVFIQDMVNSCVFILYNLVGFIIVTYLSTYISAYKHRTHRNKSNKNSPPASP